MRYCRKCGWDERPISWLRRSTVGRLAERNRWVGFLWAASNTIRVIHCPAAMDLTSVSMGGGDHLPCNGCPTISTASVHNCQAILRPPAVSVISTIDDTVIVILAGLLGRARLRLRYPQALSVTSTHSPLSSGQKLIMNVSAFMHTRARRPHVQFTILNFAMIGF